MDLPERIAALFEDSIEIKRRAAGLLAEPIARAAELMAASLSAGGKILACGNGGSAGDAQHFAAELVGGIDPGPLERPGWPAIALTGDIVTLTALANDHGYEQVFSRQIEALGRPGDVLLAISTSGKSINIVRAVESAGRSRLPVVALTGRDGGAIAPVLGAGDVEIRVPATSTARIQEVHLLVLHCVCEGIDLVLAGGER